MGLASKFIAVFTAFIAIALYFKMKSMMDYQGNPHVEDIWWGPENASKVDTSIKPFKINVPDDVLKDLKDRLDNHIPFHPPLEGANQHYGVNTKLLNTIVEFWKTKYDWREREKFLNQFPQFKVNIQGLNIHYIHAKPKNTKGVKVLPLLMIHGFQGSLREFYEIIPILTTPRKGSNIVFEVIAPSLPGFGFSDAAVRQGLNSLHIANIFKNLMNKIGYGKYYVQGGDWGAAIAQIMAGIFPDQIIGMHSNGCIIFSPKQFLKEFIGSYFPSLIGFTKEDEEFIRPMSESYSNIVLDCGYWHIQATKPDTLGVALRDSPVGLASYLLEKFTVWTNLEWRNLEDGGLTQKFSYEALLDNIMIYWINRSITTSFRLYAETFNKATISLELDRIPIDVPSGCPKFRYEPLNQADVILKEKFLNLIYSPHYEGGHFAAFEMPEVFAKDIFQFVEKVENLKNTS